MISPAEIKNQSLHLNSSLFMRPTWLKIIFALSLVAMVWSLYMWRYGDPLLNLISGDLFNPTNALAICVLCRYARILIYPLVFISGIALIRNDHNIRIYMVPSVILGIILSGYQYALMIFPSLTSGFCDPNNPCTIPYLNYFWFITIPLLALLTFIGIGAMILWAVQDNKKLKKSL